MTSYTNISGHAPHDPMNSRYWYALARCKGMKAPLLRAYHKEKRSPISLAREAPWSHQIDAFLEEHDYLYPHTLSIEKIEQVPQNTGYILACDTHYPDCLFQLDDAPSVLWYRGKNTLLSVPQIGVVGARNASLNTQKFVQKIVRELGAHGYIITSGFAKGIDTCAHEASLSTGTIAVLGCGTDVIYPQENRALFDTLEKLNGLIISEFPPGTPPRAQNFPRRNRIIAALSQSILVAEAGARSGSLITARLGNELGKDIYVIPGFPEDPRFIGSIELLKQGAIPLSTATDIIENCFAKTPIFHQRAQKTQSPSFFPDSSILEGYTAAHQQVLELLSFSPTPIDDLAVKCKTSMDTLCQLIAELELEGKIARTHDQSLVLTY